MMSKLCLINKTAPRYRESIYCALDKAFDCDWYFGETKTDIKEMDVSLLKSVRYYKFLGNHETLYWNCVVRNLFSPKYQSYLIFCESRAISDYFFYGLKRALFPKKKLYIWTHGLYGKESALEAKMKLWQYRHADGIFVYSNYSRQLMIEAGIPSDKIFTIHNSLHYDQQKALREKMEPSSIYVEHFGNENPVLVFIGRLTRVKKLDLLLDAVSSLKKQGELYNVVLIGDGEDAQHLKSRVESLGITSQVWFYGACYDEAVNAELVYNADMCVAPGNVGLTAMHTMVFGTPVITHNDFKWQMPEFEAVKEGQTGSFFQHDDVSSLVDTIHRWFEQKRSARETVRQACYTEIDTQWNPYFQMEVFTKHIQL